MSPEKIRWRIDKFTAKLAGRLSGIVHRELDTPPFLYVKTDEGIQVIRPRLFSGACRLFVSNGCPMGGFPGYEAAEVNFRFFPSFIRSIPEYQLTACLDELTEETAAWLVTMFRTRAGELPDPQAPFKSVGIEAPNSPSYRWSERAWAQYQAAQKEKKNVG